MGYVEDLEQGWLAQCQFKVSVWGTGMVLRRAGTKCQCQDFVVLFSLIGVGGPIELVKGALRPNKAKRLYTDENSSEIGEIISK